MIVQIQNSTAEAVNIEIILIFYFGALRLPPTDHCLWYDFKVIIFSEHEDACKSFRKESTIS